MRRFGGRRPPRLAHAGTVTALALLAACGGGRSVPDPPPVVAVGMDEYRFTLPPTLPRGRVVFRLTNRGDLAHDLTMVTLPADFPRTIVEQLRSPNRGGFQTRAHVPERQPGASGTFAMDLAPGRYGIVCFVEDSDGESHGRKGMAAEFRVR